MPYRSSLAWIIAIFSVMVVALALVYLSGNESEVPSAAALTESPNRPETSATANDPLEIELSPGPGQARPKPSTEDVDSESGDGGLRLPQSADAQRYAEVSLYDLGSIIRRAIKSDDVETIRAAYLELQGRGDEGLRRALDLLFELSESYGLGISNPEATPDAWGSEEAYMSIFTPELVRYAILESGDAGCAMGLLQVIPSLSGLSEAERISLAGDALNSQPDRNGAVLKHGAAYALMQMPSAESVEYARRFLETNPGPDYATARQGAVWVIARKADDDDWLYLEALAQGDRDPQVRALAEYHLAVRDITAEGIYVAGLESTGAAATAGVKVGDIIQAANGSPVGWKSQLDAMEAPIVLNLLRDGKVVTVTMGEGDYGIKMMHVPPAFPK